jgi:DNA-binding transcriptional LysR family regulator
MLYITLRQYQYVVSVADTKSMTDAASLLNVSQPSLSVAITRVEERLNRALFVRRKGAAIVVTPFGHRFVQQARALLQSATEIENITEATRPVIVGCFEDIAPWYLTKALADLRSQFPEMTFQGQEGRFSDLAKAIREGRLDMAISYDIGFDGSFNRQKIKQVAPVAFVCAEHPLARFSSIELHQLNDQSLILSAEDLSLGYIRRLFKELRVKPNIEHRTSTLEMMRSLAAHGSGVGISYSNPPSAMSYDGQPLVTIPISTPEALTNIVLVWTNLVDLDPKIETVLKALSTL